MLAIVMIAATFAAISIPAAAVDGGWNVFTVKSQDLDGYNGLEHNVAGYEYTEEGLKVTSPEEETPKTTPYVTAQTSDKYNLKEGVYMKVRVDSFTYKGDNWFSFHVWNSENIEVGKQGEDYGYGVETLIKTSGRDVNDESSWDGKLGSLHWYADIEEGVRMQCGDSVYPTQKKADDVGNNDRYAYAPEFNMYETVTLEDGSTVKCPIFILEIKWNNDSLALGMPDGMPEMYINGEKAPDSFNLKMADYFKRDDYMAHIGFSLQNSVLGGKGSFTVLQFGTDAGEDPDTMIPRGDDSRAPEMADFEYAEIADKSTVTPGEPAIVLTGDSENSNSKGKPSAYNGNLITVTDEGYINVKGTSDGYATVSLRVKDEVSYNVKDFPISLIVLRNFCTCETLVNDDTGELELNCQCQERITVFALAGTVAADNTSYKYTTLLNTADLTCMGVVKDEESGDSYMYLMANWGEEKKDITPLDGRIHGLRLDIDGLKNDMEGRNTFDVCMTGFFANTADAKAYAEDYISAVASGEIVNGSTAESSEAPTEAPSEEPTTEAPTEAPSEEPTTEAPTEAKTEANTSENNDQDINVNVNAGCGSTVGLGALAIVALAGAGLISFRKKED